MPFYNPSKIITDVLSNYLEFDPEELKLGIWSGKLSIQNVELKRDAMYPLLNSGSSPSDDTGRPPLKLKLVKGTVGHMRIRIPWKRLVWGQGDVKMQISDVTLAVAYESREETAAKSISTENESETKEADDVEDTEEVKRKKRDAKQEWLRKAERCQLQGLPLPSKAEFEEKTETQESESDGKNSASHQSGRVDSWIKSATESFAWRFLAGLDASIRNVRIVIVQDGVEIGTIFHSMNIVPKSLDASSAEDNQQDTDDQSGDASMGQSLTTPPPNFVPEGEYDDGEHLDKIVKLQGFGVFVRLEDKRSKSPKTLQFSTSVSADDYILRPTEGTLAISIFDPYPAGKQKKKKPPTIEEEPTTPTTATATVDSATSSKSRRSKREKRPFMQDAQVEMFSETPGSTSADSERPSKQLKSALKRPDRVTSGSRQFSLTETPTTPSIGNRPKSHTVDLSGGAKRAVPRANLSRATSGGGHSQTSRSIPLLPSDDTSTVHTQSVPRGGGTAVSPPTLDLDLTFGDVTTMFSSRHYQLILTFQSTVERMNNGRPDKTISSCFGELWTDKKRTVYVDAPTSAVENIEYPAITSQFPPSATKSPRPLELKRSRTTGGADFSDAKPPQRVKLQLQLDLPSAGNENDKVIRSWWQYAYSTALYEIRKQKLQESSFRRKHLQFDWEKEKYKRKEYVDLYIATRLEPASVLRTMELKVKFGTNSPEEELLKIEDELHVEQILLYRSIARSVRVRGMKTMPDSVLDLHTEQWIKASPARKKAIPSKVPASSIPPGDSLSSASSLSKGGIGATHLDVEMDCTDVNGIRREAEAIRIRTSATGDSSRRKVSRERLSMKDIAEIPPNEKGRDEKEAPYVVGRASSKGPQEGRAAVENANQGDASDGRTVRTFKTAKTSQTSATSSGDNKDSSSGGLRISASITFSTIELMVYRENITAGDSIDSMRFHPAYSGYSSGVLDTRMRSSAGLQVITNDSSSSVVSDVSILSDDQKFFDQSDDTLSIPNDESIGDVPIMSSADFLRFGLPRNVLLHVKVSGLVGKTRGQSGAQQIFSLAVDNASIRGEKESHLLSLKPGRPETRPPGEVRVEKKTHSRNKTAVSFTELERFQEQAVLVSVLSKNTGKQLQCDLSKTLVTCDLRSALSIYNFFADVQVVFPQPLIAAATPVPNLRQYVLDLLWTEKQGMIGTGPGTSNAVRLHGLEVVVPGLGDEDLASSDDKGSLGEGSVPAAVGPKVTLSTNLIEFYDGALFDDILSLSTDFVDGASRLSNEASEFASDRGWQRRNLKTTNVAKLIDGRHPASSRHSVISLSGIECNVSNAMATNGNANYKLLSIPVDVEFLLSKNDLTDFLAPSPRKQISVEVSPIRILLSEARVGILSKIATSLGAMDMPRTDDSNEASDGTIPRLAALSIQILYVLELRLSSVSMVCVEDQADLVPSLSVREIVMEESLSDFVSVLSCFNLEHPTKEAVEAAGNICVDRLVVLGLSENDAHDCVHAARLNFIAGVNAMKLSQSKVYRELAESAEEMAFGGVESNCDDSASDSVPSVKEISDDGSEESFEIIDATLKDAVEKTMSSFGSLLEKYPPDSMAFRELLVVDLPVGANLSMTRLFYDSRLECHFKLFDVRTPSGLHLLSLHCPHTHQPKRGHDVHSSTAIGDSWADDDDDGPFALSFSYFALDEEFDFGEGGLPLAILGSHETSTEAIKPRRRQQLNHLVIGDIEVLFSFTIASQVMDSISRMLGAVEKDEGSSEEPQGSSETSQGSSAAQKTKAAKPVLYAVVSSFLMTLASDELVPFSQLQAKDCTFDNGSLDSGLTLDVSPERPRLNLVVKSAELLDLTPEGYGYSEILCPLSPKDLTDVASGASFALHYYPSSDKWKSPSKLDIELGGMRLFLVRRFLNEVTQYMVSTKYGIGRLLDKVGFFDPVLDARGNPPPSLHYRVTIADSSFILPRSSTNIDMVALEVEKVTLYNGSAVSSFRMPTETSELKVPPNVVYDSPSKRSSLKPNMSNVSDSDVEFFDCVDSDVLEQQNSPGLSSFRKGWIKRTTVLLDGFRLFTSLPSGSYVHRGLEDPLIHKFYSLNGRATQNGSVYARRRESDRHEAHSRTCKRPSRFWREISASACSLEIIADAVPNVRLLITDRLVQRQGDDGILSLNLDMLLSDLCLLLSVWYSNMQELPVMFPYAPSEIEAVATAVEPAVEVPEYGTDAYVKRLKKPSKLRSEVAVILDSLTILGSFDDPGYFSDIPHSLQRYALGNNLFRTRTEVGELPFTLALDEFVLRLTTDTDGILRLGVGAASFRVADERRTGKAKDVILVCDESPEIINDATSEEGSGSRIDERMSGVERRAWADMSWGLDCNGRTLSGSLPQAFQASVFMTPGWCQTNLGFEHADAIMTDFSPIWILVDYFASYFSSAAYGNPSFEVLERKDDLKRDLAGSDASDVLRDNKSSTNVDFRLWLLHPCICVPESLAAIASPSVTIDCATGFWYHYRSVEYCTLQEMGSTDLSLRFSEEFQLPSASRLPNAVRDSRALIEGLSFGLRFSSNSERRHTDYLFRMPLFDPQVHDETVLLSVMSPEYDIKPIVLDPPKICIPYVAPTRHMGPIVSEVTLFLEVLPTTASLLQKLLFGPTECAPAVEKSSDQLSDGDGRRKSTLSDTGVESERSSFAVVAHIDSFRVYAIDPILEKHLPLLAMCVSPLELNISQLSAHRSVGSVPTGEAFPDDLQVTMKFLVWADYFKLGTTRSWEPFVEPFRCLVLYERSKRRGQGLSLDSEDAFHLNITGSLLLTVDENIRSLTRAISDISGNKDRNDMSVPSSVASKEAPGVGVDDNLDIPGGSALTVRHEIPKPIPSEDRTAFSFRNLTGQQIRVHQLAGASPAGSSKSVVSYLNHHETTTLSFDATISVIRNLEIVEVPFPGLQDSRRSDRGGNFVDHQVDIQVPGFRWLSGISVNTSGRNFDSLEPVSPVVREKVQQDWRLRNAMKILTEVGVENGGRLIASRSIFEVANKTSHAIFLSFNPDPTKYPSVEMPFKASSDTDRLLDPGSIFQIPPLLVETSLELDGHHLGSFWVRPIESEENKDLSYLTAQREENGRETVVEFCSRPIQLAKLVHESALIFKSNGGEDLESDKVKSGVQVSCPVVATNEGAPLAPFCYVVEVRRSPLVKSQELEDTPTSPASTPKQETNAPAQFKGAKATERALTNQFLARENSTKYVHGPVSYALVIHPPLVIENLLPKRGRFELMHATRRTVVWFGDLNPGDRIPIHTVGLDAPLLLMVNLGFCRTPVGEGALVHHGSDTTQVKGLYNISHGGLKSIGKAVTKGTKQFAKAAAAVAESPDKRGQGKLFLIQNPQFSAFKGSVKSKKVVSDMQVDGNPLGADPGTGFSDGKVHGIEHESFDPADIVDETVVVDSVGQRLTLNIDNVRGGGGQRRISLYCPLWIVNTTEHSLTYKQEKGSSFVSGTVVSPTKDGSRPVDDSDRNYITRTTKAPSRSRGQADEVYPSDSQRRHGIFAGTPGALARRPGRRPLSPDGIISLLDKDLPLRTLTDVAFMFNFQLDILSIFKLCVQLSDGTGDSQYSSAWSQGFSLDSVGVNQIVSMPCKDGRALEVSVTLSVAPGLLSGYTKIVRFTPRFVLVNHLERPVRIWQDSSLLHPLYEGMERPTGTSDKRAKWHFKGDHDSPDTVNQYEYLFGRSAGLDEDKIDGITAGTTANKSALYIATAGTSDVVPFHLPDTRGERQLRIDLGGSWNLTPSFSADVTGENVLKVSRAVDSRLLSHVTTRASPQYKVVLPPQDNDDIDPWDGELGVWFETDWGGDRRIIVQGIKQESYAFNYTDIHVGDELLRIDDFNVSQMTFQETMKVLKEKLQFMAVDRKNTKPRLRASAFIMRRSKKFSGDDNARLQTTYDPDTKVVLIFRTLEERLRRVRIKALKARRVNAARKPDSIQDVLTNDTDETEAVSSGGDGSTSGSLRRSTALKVDMRLLQNTAFVIVREPDPQNPPFRIENRAMDRVVFFRQRSCNSYPWNQVMPGESLSYTWEEPLRARKLVVRVGPGSAIVPVEHAEGRRTSTRAGDNNVEDEQRPADETKRVRSKRLKQLLSAQYVENEEEGGLGPSVSVKLEVIGFTDILPYPRSEDSAETRPEDEEHLNCYVDTDGITRVLIITDKKDNEDDERADMQDHLAVLRQQIQEEEARNARLQYLRGCVCGEKASPAALKSEADASEETKQEVVPFSLDGSTREESDSTTSDTDQSPVVSNVISSHSYAPTNSTINAELESLAEFPEDVSITRCHQVYVGVMEAAGLRSSDASGMCSPYCEVALKESSSSRKKFRSKAKDQRKTYYIESTTSPKWATQMFIFDISPDAVHTTRGFSIRVRVRNFHWIGNHPNLGQTSVCLSTLRNQQVLVGWYPLVGTKERSDMDDSFGSYGRGSVKLRLQWIYSVPGLLDYFLLLSERRLSNLRHSVDGMEEQLSHAIETAKTREQYTGAMGSLMGLSGRRRRAKLSASGHIRRETRDSLEDRTGRKKLPRPSIVFRMRDNLRKSREMHLCQLDSQTAESRRRRMSSSGVSTPVLEPVDQMSGGVPVPLNASIPSAPDSATKSFSDWGDAGEAAAGSGMLDFFVDDTEAQHDFAKDQQRRLRSFSGPDAPLSNQGQVNFRDDNRLLNREEFSRLVREGDTSNGPGSLVFNLQSSLQMNDPFWQNQRDETMERLLQRGFVYHDGDADGLYHNHLSYHVRQLLVDSYSGADAQTSAQNFRAKSPFRLSPVIREFRSWTAAQAVFNDNELTTDIVNNAFLIKLTDTPESSQNIGMGTSFDLAASTSDYMLPRSLPSLMTSRVVCHEEELAASRSQFERACSRSLRAVLNPGGWLTIRPMTALYLPESCTGMFVKLRYGTEVVVSETVDAKVSPTWSVDTTLQVTPYAHILVSPGKEKNSFEYGSSDLQVYIDPQKTSGSLRLSVTGERMNKSKVELGVLDIPLGAAINCCVECMEEVQAEDDGKHKSLQQPGIPAYVRWFPLMNSKDVVAVEGDLGQSGRPFESEQIRDNMFVQYFTPCLKLAFIWQPNEEINDESSGLDRAEVEDGDEIMPEPPLAETYFNADVGRVSLALIDSQRALELVALSLTDIDVRYSVTKAKTRSGLFLGWIQIDYQDDSAREPVVLAPTPGDNSQPTLQFIAIKDNLRSKSKITSYEIIWFSLREMDLALEESWMFDLWDFLMGIVRRVQARNMSTFGSGVLSSDSDEAIKRSFLARATPRGSLLDEHTTELTLGELLQDEEIADVGGKKVYVARLVLDGVRLNLSYLKGKKQGWEVNERGGLTLRDSSGAFNMTIGAGGMVVGRHDGEYLSPTYQRWSERTQDEEVWSEAEVKYSNLPKTIAAVFPSVSDAPIRLQGKVIEHVFENPGEIINSIKSYYKDTTLSQIYKIIGALDFVGNPSMVFSSFFSGVRDFFVTPSQAFLRAPNDPSRVGMGVAKGTLSLVSHSASGVFGFFSKMSASAGQVVAVLSLDDDFKQWHRDVIVAEAKGLNRQWKRRGVQSVPTMVTRPLYDIIRGVALGATGIFVNPYVGAKRRGCPGFAKGVAAGTVGVVAKPVVGVFDAISHASGSVYDMAKSANVLEKRYLPPKKLRLSYSFGPKGVLMPYAQVTARSVYLLETHPMKVSSDRAENIRALGSEIHVASEVLPMEPGVETFVVASSHRIVLFQVKKETGGDLSTNLRWQVDLTRTSSVSCKLQDQGHNGLALIITTAVPKKKVRVKLSPDKRLKMFTKDEAPSGVSQLSVNDDTADQASAPFEPVIDNDEQASELLGTEVSEYGTLASSKKEYGPDGIPHVCSVKSEDGEVIEWYTIVAEYQQSRQLTRIHNAICCIIGDFDGVSSYRSGNQLGNTEGYTSFGELSFGRKPLEDELLTTPRFDRAVCEDLNKLPWMYRHMFNELSRRTPEKQEQLLVRMRNKWLLSREVSAVIREGVPPSLVDTRARSTFVPHSPPTIPANIEDGDEIVSEILLELKQGNISYDQACDLIDSHAKSVMVCPTPEESSEVSSVTEGHDVPDDQVFRSAMDSNPPEEDDVFQSTRQNYSGVQTPSVIRFLDETDLIPSNVAAVSTSDFCAAKSSLPFLDAMDSSELRSLEEKSLELKSLKSAPLPDEASSLAQMGVSTASLPANVRGSRESLLLSPSWQQGSLRPRTESAPAGLVVPKSPIPATPLLPKVPEKMSPPTSVYDSWVDQPNQGAPDPSRLSRMESMLEHLIITNAKQISHSYGYSTGRYKDEPDMIALRQEIADLRTQVHEATSDGSRKEMIAALRKEVKLLKEELKMKKGKKRRESEAGDIGSRGQGVGMSTGVGGSLDELKFGRARPAAAKFARGLERRGESIARRLKQGVATNLEVDSTIPEEVGEDEKSGGRPETPTVDVASEKPSAIHSETSAEF